MVASSLAKIGILGGMSSQSTIEYYRYIDKRINDELGGHNAGNLVIRSVNFADIERCIRENDWASARVLLTAAAGDLEDAGADVVLMATNTMHRVAPSIRSALSVPFLHIVDTTARAIHAADLDCVGVLGTKPVMEESFYRERFARHDIEVVVPNADDRTAVDRIIFDELTHGEIRDASRTRYFEVIDAMIDAGADGIVLGCTEIDLLIESADCPSIPLFDTTELHAEAAVQYALSG